jgi:hypothetical protein
MATNRQLSETQQITRALHPQEQARANIGKELRSSSNPLSSHFWNQNVQADSKARFYQSALLRSREG